MHSKAIYIDSFAVEKTDSYAQALTAVLQEHAPILTHGDFQSKNIMIGKKDTTKGQYWKVEYGTLVIIDW